MRLGIVCVQLQRSDEVRDGFIHLVLLGKYTGEIIVRGPGRWIFGQRVPPHCFIRGHDFCSLDRQKYQGYNQRRVNQQLCPVHSDSLYAGVNRPCDQCDDSNQRQVLEMIRYARYCQEIHVEKSKHGEKVYNEKTKSEQNRPSPASAKFPAEKEYST